MHGFKEIYFSTTWIYSVFDAESEYVIKVEFRTRFQGEIFSFLEKCEKFTFWLLLSIFKISQPKLDQNSISSRYSESTPQTLSNDVCFKTNLMMRERFEFPAPYDPK